MESVDAAWHKNPVEELESGPCAKTGTENQLGQPGVLMKCGSRTSPMCDEAETLLEGIGAGEDGTDSIVPEPATSALNELDTLCCFSRVFETSDMSLHMDVDQDLSTYASFTVTLTTPVSGRGVTLTGPDPLASGSTP